MVIRGRRTPDLITALMVTQEVFTFPNPPVAGWPTLLPPTTPASAGLLLTIAAHMLFSGWSCADALTKGGSLRPNLFRKAAAA